MTLQNEGWERDATISPLAEEPCVLPATSPPG
jgi:hypothetical protein